MNNKINFLYCFDQNYNLQAFTSMISLLDLVEEKINIHVIHTDLLFLESVPEIILEHRNLNSIKSYEFIDYGFDFPNINNVHISVATYFRLFIKNYLNNQIKNIVFLDPDVVCIKDPLSEIQKIIDKLNSSDLTIAAKTEHRMGEKRIGVDSNYFNAGVMIIDFQKWIVNDLHTKLLSQLDKINENILQWDQDVLNSFFNGEYLELDEKFNFKAASKSDDKNSLLFVHYIGSHKPWLTSGTFEQDANYYHINYRKFSQNKFHITHKWKKQSVIDLFAAILTLKIFKLKKPFRYIFEFINSIFL